GSGPVADAARREGLPARRHGVPEGPVGARSAHRRSGAGGPGGAEGSRHRGDRRTGGRGTMTAELIEQDHEVFRAPNYAWIVTLDPDGSPQASVTWIDNDGSRLLVNTAAGRRKDRNAERDPRVVIAVERAGDAYDWISVEGIVEQRETGAGAEAHIDDLS